MKVTCQVSLYPLRTEHLGPILQQALQELDESDIQYAVGPMSTVLEGEDAELFVALRRAFSRVAENADVVMVATISNACR